MSSDTRRYRDRLLAVIGSGPVRGANSRTAPVSLLRQLWPGCVSVMRILVVSASARALQAPDAFFRLEGWWSADAAQTVVIVAAVDDTAATPAVPPKVTPADEQAPFACYFYGVVGRELEIPPPSTRIEELPGGGKRRVSTQPCAEFGGGQHRYVQLKFHVSQLHRVDKEVKMRRELSHLDLQQKEAPAFGSAVTADGVAELWSDWAFERSDPYVSEPYQHDTIARSTVNIRRRARLYAAAAKRQGLLQKMDETDNGSENADKPQQHAQRRKRLDLTPWTTPQRPVRTMWAAILGAQVYLIGSSVVRGSSALSTSVPDACELAPEDDVKDALFLIMSRKCAARWVLTPHVLLRIFATLVTHAVMYTTNSHFSIRLCIDSMLHVLGVANRRLMTRCDREPILLKNVDALKPLLERLLARHRADSTDSHLEWPLAKGSVALCVLPWEEAAHFDFVRHPHTLRCDGLIYVGPQAVADFLHRAPFACSGLPADPHWQPLRKQGELVREGLQDDARKARRRMEECMPSHLTSRLLHEVLAVAAEAAEDEELCLRMRLLAVPLELSQGGWRNRGMTREELDELLGSIRVDTFKDSERRRVAKLLSKADSTQQTIAFDYIERLHKDCDKGRKRMSELRGWIKVYSGR